MSIDVSSGNRGSTGRVDASKYKKAFGDKTLGEIGNSIANPNFASSKRKIRGTGSSEMGKDAFFKLMLTQLKNQDPTNPMKSHEMAAQLAQFSSLEQMSNMNRGIESLGESQKKGEQFQVLNLIGKIVGGNSSYINRLHGDKEHSISFKLHDQPEKVIVRIKDIKGKVVREYNASESKKGQNKISWNGIYDNGQDARVGDYRVEIDARGTGGRKIRADLGFEGQVTGIKYSKAGPMLLVGDQAIPLSEVKKIQSLPQAQQQRAIPLQQAQQQIQRQMSKQGQAQVGKNENIIKQDKRISKGARPATVNTVGFKDVAMSNALRAKL